MYSQVFFLVSLALVQDIFATTDTEKYEALKGPATMTINLGTNVKDFVQVVETSATGGLMANDLEVTLNGVKGWACKVHDSFVADFEGESTPAGGKIIEFKKEGYNGCNTLYTKEKTNTKNKILLKAKKIPGNAVLLKCETIVA